MDDPCDPKSDRDHIQSVWRNLNDYTRFRGSREPFFAPHSGMNAHREDSPAEAANQTPPCRRILRQKTPPVNANRSQDMHSVPNGGRFVESIMRPSTNPSRGSASDPDTFLDDLIQRTSNIVHIRILTPLPAEVCPELLKKHNVPFCHGMTSLPLLRLPLATSDPICLHSASSASTPPLLPPL